MPLFAIAAAIASAVKWAFTATSAWALAARTAIMVGASYLVNRALAPSIQDAQSRQTYPFGPQTTEAQGIPIQVAYGSTRAHANIVGHYLVITDEAGVQKNTEVSRHIMGCFGEGPWAAEPADTDVTLNARPLSDYPDVTTEWRLGLVDQTALTDWATHKQDYWVGQTCLYNEAITHTLKRTGFDEMSVILHWPKGFIHYGTDGDRHTEELSIKVEFGDAIADTWHTVAAGTISAKTALPAWKRIVASSSYAGGTPFTVTTGMRPRARVTLQTPNSTNSRHIRDVEFAAVQVERAVGFTHPGMVLLDLATVPNEVLSGGITELSVETTGKVMQDEEGDFAVSRYHADAIRDILTQPVIEGAGTVGDPWTASYYRGVDNSLLTGDGWADAKTLADTLVPDGNGNDVEMLRFDAVFAGGGSVHSATGQVAASGRCGVRYIGRQYGLWVDAPRTPVGLLCDGNCERDSRQLTPVEVDELAAEASVRYSDADSGHSERTILVIDHDADGLATVDLDLVGTTRTHEAARLARRELARNRLVDQAYACRTDIDGIVYDPGDVVYCQIDGRSTGGRVTAADATTVTLIRSVSECITGDDVIVVQVRDAVTGVQSLEIQEVVSVSGDGKTVTVASWTTQPSAGDVTLFGPADLLDDDQFEVIETSLDEHLHVNLSLLKYAPVLDDLDAIAPTVYVPLGSLSRIARYGGVTRSELPGVVIDRIGERGQIVFEWGRYTFTADDPGAGSISWATETDDDGDDAGYVNYNGTLYAPADGNTALTYVYWDPASPNVFSATDDLADVLDKYIVAKNDGGTPVLGFGWMPVTPGSASWSAIVDDGGKPSDNADVTADNPVEAFRETFENPHNDVATRWLPDGTYDSGEVSTVAGGIVGGKVLQCGNNSDNDHVFRYFYRPIPFDPEKLYRIRARVRRVEGGGSFYLGVGGIDETKTTFVRYNGDNLDAGHHWVASQIAYPTDWTVYTGYVKGHADVGVYGDNSPHPDPSDPAKLHADVCYIHPVFQANNPNKTGIYEIDYIVIDTIPEEASWDHVYGDGKPEDDADVTGDHQGDINFDNIQDGSSYKKLSAANLIALQSAIDLDVPQPRNGWEGAFTNNSPTPGYVAWSSFVIRYQGADYTIAASNTSYKFIYWNTGATKTQLYASDTFADALGTGKFIVGYNDAGTFYPAQFVKVLHGALIQAATILADHLSVATLSAITANLGTVTSGTMTMSLGGDTRLRIDSNGLYVSNNAGSTWSAVIYNDSGTVKFKADIVEAGTIVTSHLAADAVSSLTTDSSASGSFGSSLVDATVSKSGGYFRVVARGRVKSNANDEVYVYLKRGSTTIATWSKWCGNANYEDFAFNVAESPSDGSTTYSITISGTSYGGAYQSLSLEVEYHKR